MSCFDITTNLDKGGCFKVSTNLDSIGCFKVGIVLMDNDNGSGGVTYNTFINIIPYAGNVDVYLVNFESYTQFTTIAYTGILHEALYFYQNDISFILVNGRRVSGVNVTRVRIFADTFDIDTATLLYDVEVGYDSVVTITKNDYRDYSITWVAK